MQEELIAYYPYIRMELACLTSKTYAGEKSEVYPHLNNILDHELQEQNNEQIGAARMVFIALPHDMPFPRPKDLSIRQKGD